MYFIVHIRSRRKESSRSLSHLLMSFLFLPMSVFQQCCSMAFLLHKRSPTYFQVGLYN